MKTEKDVKETGESGKVFFRHVRYLKGNGVDNMGGATIAYQEVSPGKIVVAMSLCSRKDNFCRKTGRTISNGRLKSPSQSVVVESDWLTFVKTLPFSMGDMEYEIRAI